MKIQNRPAAVGISLCELFPEHQLSGGAELRITACTSDWRSCRPGDLFVAVVGDSADGHEHVEDAVRRGAVAVLAERPVVSSGVPVLFVEDSREALGIVCQALCGNPSTRLPVIGVTGTHGKTTTSCLIASIFRAAQRRAAVAGTLGYCDGRSTRPAKMTTPGAAVLADWLARSEAQGCTHAVLEVSSHALAQRRTAGMEFDAACITNIRRDHIDFHGTIENYQAAKARLFEQLREGAPVALNLDDAVCRRFYERLEGPVVTYAMHCEADVTAVVIDRCPSEQTFLLTVGNETIPVRTAIVGDHHVANCLAAASIGIAYGIDLPTIVRGLERISEMPGRMQRIECGQAFSVFVDYAQTPDTMQATLDSLRQVCSGKLICVFGAGGQRDRAKRPLLGKTVERGADLAIVTDDNPRNESPSAIIDDIVRGLKRPQEAAIIPDRAMAIRAALATAQPGDCVLVAGKGNESQQIVGPRLFEIDDREVAREWLYATAADTDDRPAMRRAA